MGWRYDDALAELEAARDQVLADGSMQLFVGIHKEEVVTLGRRATEAQLLRPDALRARGVCVRRIDRGGGATAHGPGQIVVYPVFHLPSCRLGVADLTRALLEAAWNLAEELGIQSEWTLGDPTRSAGLYVGERKLASVGFRVERGVVTHGMAINLDNDLTLFDLIAPCGQASLNMCSMTSLGRGPFDVSDVEALCKRVALHLARRSMVALTDGSDYGAGEAV